LYRAKNPQTRDGIPGTVWILQKQQQESWSKQEYIHLYGNGTTKEKAPDVPPIVQKEQYRQVQ
jgi:hypothetical protein